MPTKKRRVGFIPRSDVLDLINKLSYENNLSYSKIISILVEEALYKRGLLNYKRENETNNDIQNFKIIKDESFNNEIYAKFLIFLQFQERMKKAEL